MGDKTNVSPTLLLTELGAFDWIFRSRAVAEKHGSRQALVEERSTDTGHTAPSTLVAGQLPQPDTLYLQVGTFQSIQD